MVLRGAPKANLDVVAVLPEPEVVDKSKSKKPDAKKADTRGREANPAQGQDGYGKDGNKMGDKKASGIGVFYTINPLAGGKPARPPPPPALPLTLRPSPSFACVHARCRCAS